MTNSAIFECKYLGDNNILMGTILSDKLDKDGAKVVFEEVNKAIAINSGYKDFILNAGMVSDVTIASFGYLMKAFGVVNKTAGYMVVVMREEILQNFMLSNPEMFDFLAVFFNSDEAVEFIRSKRSVNE